MRRSEEKTQVNRRKGEQIYESEEAQRVTFWILGADEAGDIFDGEQRGEYPLRHAKFETICFVDRTHALKKHGEDAEQNYREKDDVIESAGRRLVTEDDLVPLVSPRGALVRALAINRVEISHRKEPAGCGIRE